MASSGTAAPQSFIFCMQLVDIVSYYYYYYYYYSSLDVFSFGVILTQIVCKLETIKSAMDRSIHVAQIPHTHRLRKLIDRCLREDMTRRPSARDICESIRYIVQDNYVFYASNKYVIFLFNLLLDTSLAVEETKRESKDTQPVKKVPTCSV